MATSISADMILRNFDKRGVRYRFYKDRADFLTHNRTAHQGFGPIRGVVWHNFGSSGSDTNQLAYLYRGDGPTSSKPGPLCQFAVVDDGTIVLMGWGAATHAGPGDPKVEARARTDSMPLDGELRPTTNGTMSGTVPINPFYLGFEMCHGAEGPSAAQKASLVLATAAIMEVLGDFGSYSGGSVMMHRELTTNRSDPQGVPKDGALRAQVSATLKKWATPVAPPVIAPAPAPTTPTPAPEPTKVNPPMTVTASDVSRIWTADIIPAPGKPTEGNTHWAPWSYLYWLKNDTAKVVAQVADLRAEVAELRKALEVVVAALQKPTT